MKNPPFTKYKFLKLELRVQHKKCAEVLKQIYELLLAKKEVKDLYGYYISLTDWMNLDPFSSKNLKEISDRYHFHIQKALLFLKEHNLLPPIRKGDREPREEFGPVSIYLDGMRSAYNVGSILRTTEALRIGPIYFHKKTPFIDNVKVQKTSMGSFEHVPCFLLENLSQLPRPFIALETGEKAESVSSFLFPESFTLILGNEEYGISDAVLKEVDIVLEIPLFGAKNSINAACAFAICAQEIRKQRSSLLLT